MTNPLVSIILPVYNSEKYLSKSIESVLCQSYDKWELIAVDDCSTDASAKIIENYSKTDYRIKYVPLDRNSGCYVARNTGINNASGKFLAFIDADDTYDRDYLKVLMNTAEESNADIVWCNYKECVFDEKGNQLKSFNREHHFEYNVPLDIHVLLRLFYRITWGTGSLWNKLFRKSFIDDHKIIFDEKRRRSGDWVYIIELLKNEPIVYAVPQLLYHYNRINTSSIVASFHKEDFGNFVRSHNLLESMNQELKLNVSKEGYHTDFIYSAISHIFRLYHSNYKEKSKEFSAVCNDLTLLQIINQHNYNLSLLPIRFRCYFYALKWRNEPLMRFLMKV